jgi:hypothetical protein
MSITVRSTTSNAKKQVKDVIPPHVDQSEPVLDGLVSRALEAVFQQKRLAIAGLGFDVQKREVASVGYAGGRSLAWLQFGWDLLHEAGSRSIAKGGILRDYRPSALRTKSLTRM